MSDNEKSDIEAELIKPYIERLSEYVTVSTDNFDLYMRQEFSVLGLVQQEITESKEILETQKNLMRENPTGKKKMNMIVAIGQLIYKLKEQRKILTTYMDGLRERLRLLHDGVDTVMDIFRKNAETTISEGAKNEIYKLEKMTKDKINDLEVIEKKYITEYANLNAFLDDIILFKEDPAKYLADEAAAASALESSAVKAAKAKKKREQQKKNRAASAAAEERAASAGEKLISAENILEAKELQMEAEARAAAEEREAEKAARFAAKSKNICFDSGCLDFNVDRMSSDFDPSAPAFGVSKIDPSAAASFMVDPKTIKFDLFGQNEDEPSNIDTLIDELRSQDKIEQFNLMISDMLRHELDSSEVDIVSRVGAQPHHNQYVISGNVDGRQLFHITFHGKSDRNGKKYNSEVININLDDESKNDGKKLVLQVIIYIHRESDGTKTFRFNAGKWIVKIPVVNEATGTINYINAPNQDISVQEEDAVQMLLNISEFILIMFSQIFPDQLAAGPKGGRKTKKQRKTKNIKRKTKRQRKTKIVKRKTKKGYIKKSKTRRKN